MKKVKRVLSCLAAALILAVGFFALPMTQKKDSVSARADSVQTVYSFELPFAYPLVHSLINLYLFPLGGITVRLTLGEAYSLTVITPISTVDITNVTSKPSSTNITFPAQLAQSGTATSTFPMYCYCEGSSLLSKGTFLSSYSIFPLYDTLGTGELLGPRIMFTLDTNDYFYIDFRLATPFVWSDSSYLSYSIYEYVFPDSFYSSGYSVGYNDGYDVGYDVGHDRGYDFGYAVGEMDGEEYGFGLGKSWAMSKISDSDLSGSVRSFVFSLFDAPVNTFLSAFNFEYDGFDIGGLVAIIFTGVVVFAVIKIVL